jgi:hypothetical protein
MDKIKILRILERTLGAIVIAMALYGIISTL